MGQGERSMNIDTAPPLTALPDICLDRLVNLVQFAREQSPFYLQHYGSPAVKANDLQSLPPVNKQELMENFDGWVTDPMVTRTKVNKFLADKTLIGHLFQEKYSDPAKLSLMVCKR